MMRDVGKRGHGGEDEGKAGDGRDGAHKETIEPCLEGGREGKEGGRRQEIITHIQRTYPSPSLPPSLPSSLFSPLDTYIEGVVHVVGGHENDRAPAMLRAPVSQVLL